MAAGMDEHEKIERARRLHEESREEFQQAHDDGLAALEQHDTDALADAIAHERRAIAKHRQATDEMKSMADDRLARLKDTK
jgi:hypothetical protein